MQMAEKTPAQKAATLKRCRVLLEELLADEYQRGYRDGIEKAQSIQRAAAKRKPDVFDNWGLIS